MPSSFVRLLLSAEARDFEPLVTKPGFPMLDSYQTNYQNLRRWLGDCVAEPLVRDDGSVDFFAVEEGPNGEFHQLSAACHPASEDELRGGLRTQLDALRTNLERVQPRSSDEQALHRSLQFPAEQRNCYLFRCVSPVKGARLIWCWGYRRKDAEPAAVAICANPACRTLFVRRASRPSACPSCRKEMKEMRRPAVVDASVLGRPRSGGGVVCSETLTRLSTESLRQLSALGGGVTRLTQLPYCQRLATPGASHSATVGRQRRTDL